MSSVVPYDALPGGKIVESLASAAVDGAKNKVLDEFLPTDFKSEKLSIVITRRMSRSQIPLLKLMLRGINGRILKISRSKNLFRSS